MTDMFRGYDLTAIADKVAKAHWERQVAASDLPEEVKARRTWDQASASVKHAVKVEVLPIITDVLGALESAEAESPAPRQMVEYDYNNGNREDPRWYENQHPQQHDVTTATVWALHLHMPKVRSLSATRDRILERLALLSEVTGEYTFGDSWEEWGEPIKHPGDAHMVIYFNATPDRARDVGVHLANHATFAVNGIWNAANNLLDYHISTAGDYAEQIAV